MKIVVREFSKNRPRGDRDMSSGAPSSDCEVVAIRDDGQETVLAKFSGVIPFWDTLRPQAEVVREAEAYAKNKADFFGAELLPRETFKEKIVATSSWERA